MQQEYSVAGGVKSLADILNHADRSTERNVLDSLSETDEELAEEVRRLLFVFEDLVKLDDRGDSAGAPRGRPEGPRARSARRQR